MNVVMGSIFRNSLPYLSTYIDQALHLYQALQEQGHSLRLAVVEGDSTDGTDHQIILSLKNIPHTFEKRDHHGKDFGNMDNDNRWRQSSWVWEAVLSQARQEDAVFIFMESDLVWEPDVLLKLINHVSTQDAVCPLVRFEGRFYDTWGHRARGQCFGMHPPYHPMLTEESETGLYEMDSAGSCIVMKAEIARTCHFVPAELAIVGFCQNFRSKGYRLWLDPTLWIIHPPYETLRRS